METMYDCITFCSQCWSPPSSTQVGRAWVAGDCHGYCVDDGGGGDGGGSNDASFYICLHNNQ
eukprot:14262441-Heterocapsa_arctica.AAC.1